MEFRPEDLLALSGIQHFVFCRRQWALMYVEQSWADNHLTVEGHQMHERVDDPFFSELRDGVVYTRSVPVASYRLGLYGVCDLIEFEPASSGTRLKGRSGTWLPTPVEYKHGSRKEHFADEAQLCAQAMCLEEMLSVHIPMASLYYGKIRRRMDVELTSELRNLVLDSAAEMHKYLSRGYTPRVKPGKHCRSCSLVDLCLPDLQGRNPSAQTYISDLIEGE